LNSLTLTIENHLSLARDLSVNLPNEPQIRHQIEQLIEIRNKIKEQFDVKEFIFSIDLFIFSSR
jgi:hypothetical protein